MSRLTALAACSLLVTCPLLAACGGAGASSRAPSQPVLVAAAAPLPPAPGGPPRPIEPEPDAAAPRPHPIVEAGDRLYVVLGEAPAEATGAWDRLQAAVGVDVEVAEGAPIDETRHFTLVSLHASTCVAVASRQVAIRAHVYDETAGGQRQTAPRTAFEVQGCSADAFAFAEVALALEGKHPTARLLSPATSTGLDLEEAEDVARSVPRDALPPHLVMDRVAAYSYATLPLIHVTASVLDPLSGWSRASVYVSDEAVVDVPDEIHSSGTFELIVDGQGYLMWQSWPTELRVASLAHGALTIDHDVRAMVPFDYYAADECGCG